MVKKFAETKTFAIFDIVKPLLKALVGGMFREIYIKGVTVRFGFGVLEFRKFYVI